MFIKKDMTDPWNEYEIDPAIFESFVRMGRQQTPETSRGIRAAFGADAGPAPVDLAADRAFELARGLRNSAAGARTLDLSGIDPRVLLAFGGGASAAALIAGLTRSDDRGKEGSAPVGKVPTTAQAPEVDTTFVSPEASAVEQARVLFKENSTGAPLGAIGSSPGDVPSSPNTIATTGDQRSVDTAALAQVDPGAAAFKRLMEPMSPERYKNIDDYYRDKNISEYYSDRDAYSSQPNIKRELMRYAGGTGSSPQMSADLEIWAQNFPGLAYELQRRALANQQSAEMAETPLY